MEAMEAVRFDVRRWIDAAGSAMALTS